MNFAKFLRTPFYRTPPVAASGSLNVTTVPTYMHESSKEEKQYLKQNQSLTDS